MTNTLSVPRLVARLAAVLAGATALVVIAVLLTGGKSYVVNLKLANADGLRPGSQVLLGGVSVGTVKTMDLNAQNVVVAKLNLDRKSVKLDAGTTMAIMAANLLGEEYVSLNPGKSHVPLQSGSTLPESATTVPTDLDQLVDVLGGQTRENLAVLLQEAGVAVAGRKSDISAILAQMPLSITAANKLLSGLVTDNHSLSDLVSNSDHFIAQVNANGTSLKRVIDSAAGAVQTFSDQAGSLAKAVQGAPAFLSSVGTNFTDIQTTFADLTPVAGELARSTQPLDSVLRNVQPFAKSAVPTLNRAANVAPALGRLAVQAAPTLKRAIPTISSLSNLAKLSQPLSAWLGLTAQDLWNIPSGWSHAIQFRDGISHVFHGDLYLDPSIVLNLADKDVTAAQKRTNLLDVVSPSVVKLLGLGSKQAQARAEGGTASAPSTSGKAASTPATGIPTSVGGGVSGILKGVGSGLSGVINKVTNPHGASGTGTSSQPTTTTTASTTKTTSGLSSLLGYLLGK